MIWLLVGLAWLVCAGYVTWLLWHAPTRSGGWSPPGRHATLVPMPLPPAARQLIRQVTEHREDATWTVNGNPDGFGRHRSVLFDAETSQWLAPIMEVLAKADDRIASAETDGDRVEVTFVPDIRADSRQPFQIDEVDEVLTEDDEATDEENHDD